MIFICSTETVSASLSATLFHKLKITVPLDTVILFYLP